MELIISNRLNGKVVLITGGSSGLGLATAKCFVAEGARLFITGRRQDELDKAVQEIGPSATGVQGDIAKLADLDRLFGIIKEKAGRLDVLFANAGGGEFMPLGSITEAHFDKYFRINVKGTLFTVQKALPLMPHGASIILNGSMVSIKGFPSFSVYAATKAALRSFARSYLRPSATQDYLPLECQTVHQNPRSLHGRLGRTPLRRANLYQDETLPPSPPDPHTRRS